jgi:hypothetical protein
MQCLSQKDVAVSKPCCPACWDIMEALRTNGNSDVFKVRSCHPTVYPVELPVWLPKEVQKFRGYLVEQLQIMDLKNYLRGPGPFLGHRHTYSIESDSGLSIASGVTESSDLQAGEAEDDMSTARADRRLAGHHDTSAAV